jgi:hypothetical protein
MLSGTGTRSERHAYPDALTSFGLAKLYSPLSSGLFHARSEPELLQAFSLISR